MTVTRFRDFPLAGRDRDWDGDAARKRIRRWANAEERPNAKYRDAHLWYDKDDKRSFDAYKLPIADVIGGKLTAVPRGIMAAAAILQGARGGVDIPPGDVRRAKAHLSRYYEKMGDQPPWEKKE